MTDRHGPALHSGDPVLFLDAGEVLAATVLRELPTSRYLIQLDPRGPRTPQSSELPADAIALLDRNDAALRDAKTLGVDPQEPFEVAGSQLEFVGEGGDEDGED